MAFHAMKTSALAVGLFLGAAAVQAQNAGDGLPRRPAPVSGKVSADPGTLPLHPAPNPHLLPVVSTARQVPPPANLNEPLLKSESPTRAASDEASPASAPSATSGSPRRERTVGRKLPQRVEGRDKTQRPAGQPHEDRHPVGHRKRAGRHASHPASSSRRDPAVSAHRRSGHARVVAKSAAPSANRSTQKTHTGHRQRHGHPVSTVHERKSAEHPARAHGSRRAAGETSGDARRLHHPHPAREAVGAKSDTRGLGHAAARKHTHRAQGAGGGRQASAERVSHAAKGPASDAR